MGPLEDRMVIASGLGWSVICYVVSLTPKFVQHCLYSPRCINGSATYCWGAMHLIQGREAILPVASCYRNLVKLRPNGQLRLEVRL